jgi:iron complex outermembrane receptor protein
MSRYGYEAEAREHHVEMIVSGPVTPTLGVRLAGMYSNQEGFYYNKATAAPGFGGKTPKDPRIGATEGVVLRGTLLWRPDPAFDARLKINYTRDDSSGDASGSGQLVSCPDGKATPAGIPFYNPADNCRFDRNVYITDLDPTAFPLIRNNGVRYFDMTQKFGTLEANYRPTPDLTLTSLTGFYRVDTGASANAVLGGYAAAPIAVDNVFNRREFTEEVRLTSEFAAPANFTLGAFYQDGRINNHIRTMGNRAIGEPLLLQDGSHRLDIKTYSAFGQARWKPIDPLEIALGARYTDERRSDAPLNFITGSPQPVTLVKPRLSARNWSPEFTVTYTPSDAVTLFGSLKQAYKSGSFSITTPVSNGANNAFGDERVRGGEVGLKSRLLDRRLALNLAAYDYNYRGLQVGANEPTTAGIPVIRTINAGGAEVYGLDFDGAYRPPQIEGLNLTGSINWNHARFTKLDNAPCWGGQTIAMGCNGFVDPRTGLHVTQDLTGSRLVRAPTWQVSGGFDYSVPLSERLKLTVGGSGRYTSWYKTTLHDRPDSYMPGFAIFDANLALAASDDSWEVALIGNNIANKLTYGYCQPFNFANGSLLGGEVTGGTGVGPAGIDEVQCVGQRGREVWLRVTVRPTGLFR